MPPSQNHHVPACTATPEASIWSSTPQETFRQRVVELEKLTNAVPLESQVFDSAGWLEKHPPTDRQNSRLTLPEEQQLTNDVSFLAAVGEGAQSVAAATLQESAQTDLDHDECPTLRFTIASVDAIDRASQAFLHSILDSLAQITAARKDEVVQSMFVGIAKHHGQRLLNRLRSVRWQKPTYLSRTHKKPLHADYANLIHRAQFLYARNERRARARIEENLAHLASLLQEFENPPADDLPETEDQRRCVLIKACYDFCIQPETAEYLRRMREVRSTAQIQAAFKTLQQTEKIAAYYRISNTLADIALAHPALFRRVNIDFLPPYEGTPLEIAHQPWATLTHVHAEVNLAVHHDLACQQRIDNTWKSPRCVGASKYLCYLCYLFLRNHGSYFPSSTHGACYDQWTIPDLAEYSEDLRDRYRKTIGAMTNDICEASISPLRRVEPMTSRENLIEDSSCGKELPN